MSDHKYNQNILIGAAVAAGILGTLTSLLGFSKNGKKFSSQAKDIANQVLDSGDVVNKKMVLGGVAGGLVGAAAALLLAPKSGAELMKDMARPFSHETEHKHSGSHKTATHKKGARKTASHKKGVLASAKTAVNKVAKTVEKKVRKATSKKASTRRRPTVASKAVALAEKVAHEIKEA